MLRLRSLLALALICLPLAACGSGLATGVGLHVLSHTGFAHRHTRLMQSAWCAYHVSRLRYDLHHHHLGFAAYQAVMSGHNCSRALLGR